MIEILCMGSGDGNRTFEKITSSLAKRGANVSALVWDRTGTAGASAVRNGVEYCYLMSGWGYKNKKLLIARIWWMIRLFFYLLRQKPDILWAANFDSALPSVLAAIVTHVPIIYYIHDNISISYSMPAWLRRLVESVDSWVIRRAAVVFVPDENRILSHAEEFRAKFVITPNTPNSSSAPPLRKVKDRSFTVYATGSLEVGRGTLQLLEATKNLPDCRVLLAGRTPEAKVIKAIEIHPRTTFKGELTHEEALDLYNEADVVFAFYDPTLPIYLLASPTKLYEAMMMAKPVIINRETMMSTKVQEWEIGYVSEYYDVTELETLLRYISQHRTDAESKGARARVIFDERFDWRLLDTKLWQIVEDVAAKREIREWAT